MERLKTLTDDLIIFDLARAASTARAKRFPSLVWAHSSMASRHFFTASGSRLCLTYKRKIICSVNSSNAARNHAVVRLQRLLQHCRLLTKMLPQQLSSFADMFFDVL